MNTTYHDPNVQFELMRPSQVQDRRKRGDIAFLPVGVLEWHGIHNPLGTDALKAHHVCSQAARKLDGGVVFPALTWGIPRDSFYVNTQSTMGDLSKPIAKALGAEAQRVRGFSQHGGMDVQEQWLFFQRLVRMSLESIAGFGFRSIYIVTGHNPLIHWVKPVAITFTRASQMAGQHVTVSYGGEFDAAGLAGDHAGKWETSLMMDYDPSLVDINELQQRPEFKGVGHGLDAVDATAEQGAQWIETCASAIAKEARWLIDNYPELPAHMTHRR